MYFYAYRYLVCERTEFVPEWYDFCDFNIKASSWKMVLIFPSLSHFVYFSKYNYFTTFTNKLYTVCEILILWIYSGHLHPSRVGFSMWNSVWNFYVTSFNLDLNTTLPLAPYRFTTSKWIFWLYILGIQFNFYQNITEICILGNGYGNSFHTICPTSYKNLPIGMKVEITISWLITTDQDIIYNYISLQNILFNHWTRWHSQLPYWILFK